MSLPDGHKYRCSLQVGYPTEEHAQTVCNALKVDEELHADKVTKVLSTEGCQLKAEFAACDARMLRVSVNSFFDMTALATQTLDAF